MKKLALLSVMLMFNVSTIFGQCTNQVLHLDGLMNVNGVDVTVSSSGYVTSNSIYCFNTLPYFIGYNYDSVASGTGSYRFEFSPAVSMLTLNFSGLSGGSGHYEEVRLFVNGDHYAIPAAGSSNGCDAMAVLTDQGNIAPCANCSVSGWMGTSISGPIYSLTVQDTVIIGQPAGAIFSLFICDNNTQAIFDQKTMDAAQFSPNPFVTQTVLKLPHEDQNTTFTLYNLNGQRVKTIHNIANGQVIVERDGLPSGIYYYMIRSDYHTIKTGKLIAE